MKIWSANFPDNKVHGVNMGPTWVLSALVGPHVGPMNLAIRFGMCGILMSYDKTNTSVMYNPGLCWITTTCLVCDMILKHTKHCAKKPSYMPNGVLIHKICTIFIYIHSNHLWSKTLNFTGARMFKEKLICTMTACWCSGSFHCQVIRSYSIHNVA